MAIIGMFYVYGDDKHGEERREESRSTGGSVPLRIPEGQWITLKSTIADTSAQTDV